MTALEQVYRSDRLNIRAKAGADVSTWVVTFDNFGHDYNFERKGFAETLLEAHGLSFVTVVGRGNDWYQYDDMMTAMDHVRAHLPADARIMTYGSSMGGYAALRFAHRLDAFAVLALSPQYSNDPAKTPFEIRWLQQAHATRWIDQIEGPLRSGCRPVVAYDSHGHDRLHVDLIAGELEVQRIALPFTGHPISTFLSSCCMLQPLFFGVLNGDLNPSTFQKEARARSKMDPVYLSELSRNQPRHRDRWAISIARRAVEIGPDSPFTLHNLGKRLTDAGRADEALPLYEKALLLSENFIGYVLPYSEALLAAGKVDEAADVAKKMVADHPDLAQLHAWLSRIEWIRKNEAQARLHIATAIELDPFNRIYRKFQENYHSLLTIKVRDQFGNLTRVGIFVAARKLLGRLSVHLRRRPFL